MTELIQKVLDVALGEVGYIEKETYDQLDDNEANPGDENYTKYQRDLAKLNYFNGSKKGVAWCAVFACWVLVQVVGEAMAKKLLCQPNSGNAGAGCNAQMNYYKDKGQFFTSDPQVGDQVIFWNSDKTEANHIGWIYKVDKTRIYTVEGNTTGTIPFVQHGGIVGKQKYKLTYDRIAGYGRPRWELAEGWIDTTESEQAESDSKTETAVSEEAVEIPSMITGDAWVHVTSGSTVNYRTKPSITASCVSGMPRIKQGEQVYIKTSGEGWAAVEYKDYRGYVMLKYLTQENPNEENVDMDEVVSEDEPAEEPKVVEERTYTAVKGDTLWAISCRMLGSGRRYKEIMRVNGMRNTIIRPGMVLKIPEK